MRSLIAGADQNGYAVCNDGWSSSVSYFAMSECQTSIPIPRCVSPTIIGCFSADEYSRLRTGCAATGSMSVCQSTLDQCQQQIDEYNKEEAAFNQCMADLTSGKTLDNLMQQYQSLQSSRIAKKSSQSMNFTHTRRSI